MKKSDVIKTTTILITIAIVFALLVLFYRGFSETGFENKQAVLASQQQLETETKINQLATTPPLSTSADNTPAAAKTLAQETADITDSKKMDYDSDWCIAVADLTQQDLAHYQRELQDWYIARGGIPRPMPDGYASTSSQHLLPYMEATYDAIWQQIQQENEYAMIAALGRMDFAINTQRKIAQRLVVKGHTKTALSHLVMIELNHAQMIYRRVGHINTEIKESINKAMAYISYGIKLYDLTAAYSYFIMVSYEDFPAELKPLNLLGRNNHISDYILHLEQLVDTTRTEENLLVASLEELSKIVKHDFESTLAYLYRTYGNELNALKNVLPDTTGAMLEDTECVQRQIEFFNYLEQGRKVSSQNRIFL